MSDHMIHNPQTALLDFVTDFVQVSEVLTSAQVIQKVDFGSAEMIVAKDAKGEASVIVLTSSGDAIAIPADFFMRFV